DTVPMDSDSGRLIGSVGYMAPEQVPGRPADARADVFSLGAVLYEVLSGRRPFQRETAADTLAAILHEEPPDIADPDANIPPTLLRSVRRCLEKVPAARFQSASDLAFALAEIPVRSAASRQFGIASAPSGATADAISRRPWGCGCGGPFRGVADRAPHGHAFDGRFTDLSGTYVPPGPCCKCAVRPRRPNDRVRCGVGR